MGVGETRVGGTKVVYVLYRACPFRAHSIRALLTEASLQHFMSPARSFAYSGGRNSEGERLLLFNNRYKKLRYRTQDRLASVETCHGKAWQGIHDGVCVYTHMYKRLTKVYT